MSELHVPGLLAEPEIRIEEECGRGASAYVALREGVKASHCVQPNPDVLVFFYVADDGIPIGIRFLEPADGLAVCQIFLTLAEGPDGPAGVRQDAVHHFFTREQLARVMKATKQTLEKLKDGGLGATNGPSL